MSLTSLIEKNETVKNIIKNMSPAKAEFTTNIGCQPFYKDCPFKAPYTLTSSSDAALVGTAADYLFRFVVASTIKKNKESVFDKLVCEAGIDRFNMIQDKELVIKVSTEYSKGMSILRRFVSGERIDLGTLAEASLRLAYLDSYYRGGGILPANPSDIYSRTDEILIGDIVRLAEVFIETFVVGKIVTSESDVVFNPTFGTWSKACGGADADIYIDGTLYDFKCTKTIYKDWTEIGQIYGYYLLYGMCKTDGLESEEPWITKPISAIALYKGRHGLINRFVIKGTEKEFTKVDLTPLKEAIGTVSNKKKEEMTTSLRASTEELRRTKKEILTTTVRRRHIPISCFKYLIKQRVRIAFEGYAKVDNVLSDDTGDYVIFTCENGKRYKSEFRLFSGGTYIIYDDEEILPKKSIYHDKYGFGIIEKIDCHKNITELTIVFEDFGIKTIVHDSKGYAVARRIIPQFTSCEDYPFKVGEKVILHDSKHGDIQVTIDSLIEENKKIMVNVHDAKGSLASFPIGMIAMKVSDEVIREDLLLIDMATGKQIIVDENLKVGTEVKYSERVGRNEKKDIWGSILSVYKKNNVVMADVDFGECGERTFIGKRFS